MNISTSTIRFLGSIALATVLSTATGCAYQRDDSQAVLTSNNAASDFSLATSEGTTVSLSELRSSGPVVLVFYRGSWCPWCKGQLGRFQQQLPEIEGEHARVVAISVDPPEKSRELAKKLSLTFPLLSDPDGKVAAAYGVFDAGAGYNKPATVIVGKNGVVRYRYVGEGFRDRVEPSAVVAFLHKNQSREVVASGVRSTQMP
jgi:peroxiredoxin